MVLIRTRMVGHSRPLIAVRANPMLPFPSFCCMPMKQLQLLSNDKSCYNVENYNIPLDTYHIDLLQHCLSKGHRTGIA